jgi:DNA-binding XRE family transcriptional regulator
MDKVVCKLKEIRLKEHLCDNKTEFAKFLGEDLRTYMNWEAGGTPTLTKALKVAKILNKKIEDIWHLE